MKKVRRDQIVDYVTYEDERDAFKKRVLSVKAPRRIDLGEHVTLTFETTDTVRGQVQEMMRIEKIVRESEIQHELDTYNEILGDTGELGATLLIGIDDPEERDVKLREWLTLPKHLYVEVEGGEKVRATFDQRQVGADRLSSVQFVKFDTRGRLPVAFGIDHPALNVRTTLSDDQRSALAADLAS